MWRTNEDDGAGSAAYLLGVQGHGRSKESGGGFPRRLQTDRLTGSFGLPRSCPSTVPRTDRGHVGTSRTSVDETSLAAERCGRSRNTGSGESKAARDGQKNIGEAEGPYAANRLELLRAGERRSAGTGVKLQRRIGGASRNGYAHIGRRWCVVARKGFVEQATYSLREHVRHRKAY